MNKSNIAESFFYTGVKRGSNIVIKSVKYQILMKEF